MSNDTLAQSLYALARDPQYTPEGAAARIAVVLAQVQKAALHDITQPMVKMAQAGVNVSLTYGPQGWVYRYRIPIGDMESQGSGRGGRTPGDAVQAGYQHWKSIVEKHETEARYARPI